MGVTQTVWAAFEETKVLRDDSAVTLSKTIRKFASHKQTACPTALGVIVGYCECE